jgi:hypothetical protein
MGKATVDPSLWPLFAGHGIVVTDNREQMGPGRLKLKPDPEMLIVHGQGVHDGRPCLVLRTHTLSGGAGTWVREFWVDTARASAVVRQVEYSNGKISDDKDIQYQQTRCGWLPKSWTFTVRNSAGGKTLLTERMQIKELTLDPPVTDADFRIDVKPGMLVKKSVHGDVQPNDPGRPKEEKFYRIRDNGDWNEVVIANGVERSRWSLRSIWWVAGLVTGAVTLAWGVRRWQHSRRSATHS